MHDTSNGSLLLSSHFSSKHLASVIKEKRDDVVEIGDTST